MLTSGRVKDSEQGHCGSGLASFMSNFPDQDRKLRFISSGFILVVSGSSCRVFLFLFLLFLPLQ